MKTIKLKHGKTYVEGSTGRCFVAGKQYTLSDAAATKLLRVKGPAGFRFAEIVSEQPPVASDPKVKAAPPVVRKKRAKKKKTAAKASAVDVAVGVADDGDYGVEV